MNVHDYNVHAMLNFFLQHFPVIFIQFFYRQQVRARVHNPRGYVLLVRGLPVQLFYISANDGPDLYIREPYKLGFL